MRFLVKFATSVFFEVLSLVFLKYNWVEFAFVVMSV